MNRFKKFLFGGIQSKVVNLMLVTTVLILGAYLAIMLYQSRFLTQLFDSTTARQQASISDISEETMHGIINGNLTRSAQMEANVSNMIFSNLRNSVDMIGDYVTKVMSAPDEYPRVSVSPPDPARDGDITLQLLHEEGVDINDPGILAKVTLLGNMTDMLTSMLESADNINSAFIGTPEGIFLIADDCPSLKYDRDGMLNAANVRSRPWYKAAVEQKQIVFTDIEPDQFSSDIGIVCAMPVYVNGELVCVVGADLFLNSMREAVHSSTERAGFVFIVNHDGHVILSPQTEGTLKVQTSDMAQDLRKTADYDLANFISDALQGSTEVRLVSTDGTDYYMAGSPLPTVGWALISAVRKDLTDRPTVRMLESYSETQEDAISAVERSMSNSRVITVTMLAIIFVLVTLNALIMGQRIVKPLDTMTRQIRQMGDNKLEFVMEDTYRTGDEIQILAESFSQLAKETLNYLDEVKRATAEKERIGAELGMARNIQTSQLPHVFPPYPDRREFDLYATMTPTKEVGGDFYDFFLIDHDHLALVMADVSGKGIPAALFMMKAKTLIKSRLVSGESPSDTLANVNRLLLEGNDAGMFVTVWLAVLDLRTGQGVAANAGHEHPIIKRAYGPYEPVVYRHSPAVATIDDIPFRQHEFKLEKGDTLFVYTDGVPEATDKNNELFGLGRLVDTLNKDQSAPPERVLSDVMDGIRDFVGDAEQFDDITMLCIKYNGAAADV